MWEQHIKEALISSMLDRSGTNQVSEARFYPYGDEITSTANDREKFATYTRDSYTGLDYADQRYYASIYGRFNTPDPYVAGGAARGNVNNPSDPGTWNRYEYVGGDPANRSDPDGTDWIFIFNPPPSLPLDPFAGMNPAPVPYGVAYNCLVYGTCQVSQSSEGGTSGPLPFPQCNPSGGIGGAVNLSFLASNYLSASQLSQQFGIPVDWLLGWVALESSATSPIGNIYGAAAQSGPGDNNFLGQTGSGWVGQTSCGLTVTTNGGASTFACFANFAASLTSAIISFGSKYGSILMNAASNHQTALQAFTAVYAQWGDPGSTAAAQANLINSQITNHIDPMLNCLQQNGYLGSPNP